MVSELCDVACKPIDEHIERDTATGTGTKVLMHRHPGLQLQRELGRQHPRQRVVAFGQRGLAAADARTAADQRKLREVAVGAYRERFAVEALERAAGLADEGARLVESDQGMPRQLAEPAWHALPSQVVLARKQADFDVANAACNQLLLLGPHH